MAKLNVGEIIPNFEFVTPYEGGRNILDECKKVEGKTALVFLRYYGCPLCQFEIAEYAKEYDRIKAETNGQILVVLQSDPVKLKAKLEDKGVPYDIVCDPEMKLYKDFDIKPMEKAPEGAAPQFSSKELALFAKIKEGGYEHGEYEGNEEQLPATFILDCDGKITYADYPTSMAGSPMPDELIELMK